MSVVTHGLCIGGEVVQAVGTDKAKVVVHSLQMVNHHSLILTLFAAPEQKDRPSGCHRALVEWMPLEPMIFSDCGQDDPKEVDVLWESPCHLVGGPEIFLATPTLLHFMDLRAQEVGGGDHMTEN